MSKFYTLNANNELVETKAKDVETLSLKSLVLAYNAMAKILDDNLVTRFASKNAAIKRLNAISNEYASVKKSPKKATKKTADGSRTTDAYPTKDGMVPDADALQPSKITRANPYAGKTIYDNTGAFNPRRELCQETKAPARAWLCFNIIINAGIKGISFEDYIAAGGNLRDLHHDHKLERVVIK